LGPLAGTLLASKADVLQCCGYCVVFRTKLPLCLFFVCQGITIEAPTSLKYSNTLPQYTEQNTDSHSQPNSVRLSVSMSVPYYLLYSMDWSQKPVYSHVRILVVFVSSDSAAAFQPISCCCWPIGSKIDLLHQGGGGRS
jgi:hypothetical protein